MINDKHWGMDGIVGLLYCAPNTNATLYLNYTEIKIKKRQFLSNHFEHNIRIMTNLLPFLY